MSRDRGSFSIPAATIALTTIAVVVLSWGVVSVVVGAQEDGSQPSLTPATDSVTFGAEFQAEEKAPEVMTRWAKASVGSKSLQTNGVGDRGIITEPETQRSESWSTTPLSVSSGEGSYSSNACIHGGRSGPGGFCEQDGQIVDLQGEAIAGASTSEGDFSYFVNSSLLGLGLSGPSVSLTTQNTISTGVRCYLDASDVPRSVAARPEGTIFHGTDNALGEVAVEGSFSLRDIDNGQTYTASRAMNASPGDGFFYAEVTPQWDVSPDGLSAYSQVELKFRVTNNQYDSGWHAVTFHSECGFTMNEQQPVSPFRASPQPRIAAPTFDDPPVTSATGSPRTSGFTTEDTLSLQGMDYHLLATRELDALDRREIEAVLAEIVDSGDVEGTNWKLFDAQAAGELVPVIEVELVDGAVVQVRPIVDGVALPLPDVVPTTSVTPTTPAAVPPAPTTSSPTTSTAPTPEGDDDE